MAALACYITRSMTKNLMACYSPLRQVDYAFSPGATAAEPNRPAKRAKPSAQDSSCVLPQSKEQAKQAATARNKEHQLSKGSKASSLWVALKGLSSQVTSHDIESFFDGVRIAKNGLYACFRGTSSAVCDVYVAFEHEQGDACRVATCRVS